MLFSFSLLPPKVLVGVRMNNKFLHDDIYTQCNVILIFYFINLSILKIYWFLSILKKEYTPYNLLFGWPSLKVSHLKINFNLFSHLDQVQQPSLACYSSRPIEVVYNLNLLMVNMFVKIFDGFSFPKIFINVNSSFSSKVLWNDNEDQCVLFYNEILIFFVICISHLLLLYKTLFWINFNFVNKPWSHINSLLDFVIATYSTSVVYKATIFCICDIQLITVVPIVKM